MNKKVISIIVTTVLALGLNFPTQANTDLDDVTMDITTKEVKRGQRINFEVRETIQNFQLENGDITQEEIDNRKAERAANRAEMQALKESGDVDALMAKRDELKAQHSERRQAMKEYIDNNEELKTALQTQKEEIKAARREQKAERREHKKESKPQIDDVE